MSFLHSNRFKKIFAISMIALSLSLIAPKKSLAYAGIVDVVIDPTNLVQNTVSAVANPITATMTTLEKVKHYILDPIAWSIAKRMINRLTVQTVNWINSGFEGNPLYLTNPQQFFLDIGDKAASQLLSNTSLNRLCTPFKAELRVALLRNYLRNNSDDFSNYSCSLSILANNYDQFIQDFTVGGWDGWFELTQNENNNPYGVYLQEQTNLGTALAKQAKKFQDQLNFGKGFFSFEQCPPGQTVTQQYINDALARGDDSFLNVGDCLVKKETVTPGTVIETQLANQLGSGIKQLELADSFNEIVSALVTQLIKKVTGGGAGGEVGLRNIGKTDPQFVAPPPESETEPTIYIPAARSIQAPSGQIIKAVFIKHKAKAQEVDLKLMALATDYLDGDISEYVRRTGSVDTRFKLVYPLVYTVQNSRGFSTTTNIIAIVNDDGLPTGVPPTIGTPTIPPNITPPDDEPPITIPPPTVPSITCTPDGNGGFTCTIPTTPGGGGGCTPGGIGNDPSPVLPINESQIIWDDYDISGWAVTANLSVSASSNTINLNYDRANTWPNVYFSFFAPDPVVGNAWVVAWRNGAWHASTFEWLRPGQTAKDLHNLIGADGTLASPLGNFTPKVGETYGFVVSTPARGGNTGPVSERSNVYTMVWNGGICTSTTTPPPVTPPPVTPPPSTGPLAPTITSITPTSVTSGVTTITINGTNLRNTSTGAVNVVFQTSAGPSSVPASANVNSSGTQTTVLVPSGLTGSSVAVYINNGTNLVSNSITLQLSQPVVATVPSTAATQGWGGAIDFNTTNGTWMVVSAVPNIIYGRIMNDSGTASGAEFAINTNQTLGARAPKVAYAADINKYLVVWIDFPGPAGRILGRFVNPDGTLFGNEITIFTDPAGQGVGSFFNHLSILQYDATRQKFVFVWEFRTPSIDSRLVTISSSGVVGPVVDVGDDTNATNGGGAWAPILAINEAFGEYCIAYVKGNGTAKATRRYDAVTGALGPEVVLNNTDTGPTGLVYAPAAGKYLISWGSPSGVSRGRFLNSCSITNGGTIFTVNSAGSGATVAYNPQSNLFASIVQDQNDSGNTYKIIDANGAQVREGIAFAGGFGNFDPVIMPNLTTGTFTATAAYQYNPTMFAPGL